MSIRQILILIISILALFLTYNFYANDFCPKCCTEGEVLLGNTSEISDIVKTAAGPLVFNWNDETPIVKDGFNQLKSDILAGKGGDSVLEITGNYFADEEKPDDFENMGLARADKIGSLLFPSGDGKSYRTFGKKVDDLEGAKSNEFEAFSYNWINKEEAEKETIEVMESGDIRILFPFNSSNKIDRPEIDDYLSQIATRLKNDSSLKIYIVGHTDSLGEPGANRRLSERRAKKIRDILKKKGVPNKQIVPSGRGEADPVAPNTNEASRLLNRRVDITIK